MMQLQEFLQHEILENKVQNLIAFGLILLLGLVLRSLISRWFSSLTYLVFRKFSRNAHGEKFVVLLQHPFELLVTVTVVVIAFSRLHFPESWHIAGKEEFGIRLILEKLTQMGFIISITWILLRNADFVAYVMRIRAEEQEPNNKARVQLIVFVKELIKILMVIISLFFTLGKVFEMNVASLIAGLGIGGLAVALAAQDTIANLLGSFLIFLDKPFEVGDYVKANDFEGTVESIGFRSTRIRTLDQSLLTVPNKKVMDAVLNNVTKSTSRRVKQSIDLEYGTDISQLQHIAEEIKKEITAHPLTLETVHVALSDFKESALAITVIYFVQGPEFDTMNRVREELNLKIIEIVERNNAKFAFPSRSLYITQADENKG